MAAQRNVRVGFPLRLEHYANRAIQSFRGVRSGDRLSHPRELWHRVCLSQQCQELSATPWILVGSFQERQDKRSGSLRDSYRPAHGEFGWWSQQKPATGEPRLLDSRWDYLAQRETE